MVIQRLPLGLAMLQEDGRFAYWNEEFMRLAGHGATAGMDGDGWWRNMCPDEARRQRMQRRFEAAQARARVAQSPHGSERSEEHTSELQSPCNLVCRLLLEKKQTTTD